MIKLLNNLYFHRLSRIGPPNVKVSHKQYSQRSKILNAGKRQLDTNYMHLLRTEGHQTKIKSQMKFLYPQPLNPSPQNQHNCLTYLAPTTASSPHNGKNPLQSFT